MLLELLKLVLEIVDGRLIISYLLCIGHLGLILNMCYCYLCLWVVVGWLKDRGLLQVFNYYFRCLLGNVFLVVNHGSGGCLSKF